MGRRPTGHQALSQARKDLASAKTVEQLRTAQAVVMPLDLGLSLHQTAELIGMSAAWVGRARIRYLKGNVPRGVPDKRGGARNNLLPQEEEKRLVEMAELRRHWRGTAKLLKKSVEQKLGRTVALSTIYNMLRRSEYAKELDEQAHLREWILSL